MKNIVS